MAEQTLPAPGGDWPSKTGTAAGEAEDVFPTRHDGALFGHEVSDATEIAASRRETSGLSL